jgi:hypothetical protein
MPDHAHQAMNRFLAPPVALTKSRNEEGLRGGRTRAHRESPCQKRKRSRAKERMLADKSCHSEKTPSPRDRYLTAQIVKSSPATFSNRGLMFCCDRRKTTLYIDHKPDCPAGGDYSLNAVREKCTCSVPVHVH